MDDGEQAMEIDEIQREEFTVTDRIFYIQQALASKGSTTFKALFNDSVSKYEVIITFMALLEMIKLNDINILQNSPYEDIVISLKQAV